MKYSKIRKMDISNGPGIRVSIFMQGCTFHCEGCFNPETWDFNEGIDFTDETINEIMKLCENQNIEGLSILGGEPLHPKNIEGSTKLAKAFKEKFPKKNLWVWSGFLFEKLKDKEIFKYIDVLVDGQFKIKLKNPKLKYCGSSNQRVIDVQKSLKKKDLVFYYKNEEENS
ncbi:MAG: anaerobic ribonucleoside-triphosphate reductase activating protein [Bacilli bacterium]|nr:anaerobic ribonucleoside-triphosphate reductase activating protein [Bacilli bacterium]